MVTLIVEQPSASVLSVEQPAPATMSADEAIMVSVDDYEELSNKPSIAGVELTGNKSLDDLGAYTKAQVDTKLSAKADKSQIPSLEGYATEEWVEDKHYLTTAPVESVNGKTGAVTVTEGLAPLIGTTATVTPQQVMTALGEGRDICITGTAAFPIGLFQLPVELKFTAWERITDTANGNYGQFADVVVSQCMYNLACWTIVGGSYQGQSLAWKINYNGLVSDTLSINGHLLEEGSVVLTASDVGALPSSTVIPSKTSDLTNDSGFITLSDLPIYNGSVS